MLHRHLVILALKLISVLSSPAEVNWVKSTAVQLARLLEAHRSQQG